METEKEQKLVGLCLELLEVLDGFECEDVKKYYKRLKAIMKG